MESKKKMSEKGKLFKLNKLEWKWGGEWNNYFILFE